MAIEIRELTIKTAISTYNNTKMQTSNESEMSALKNQLLTECKRMLAVSRLRDRFSR
jgi:hypothetical protein